MRANKDAASSFSTSPKVATGSDRLLVDQGFPGKQRVIEAELGEIANAARIEDAVQVVDLVLHDPGVEILHRAIDRGSRRIEAGIAQFAITRHQAAHPRNR